MATVKAILIKPLDGIAEGETREFEQADFDALKAYGAVKAVPAAKAPEPKAKARA
jgi:hypothetical protein